MATSGGRFEQGGLEDTLLIRRTHVDEQRQVLSLFLTGRPNALLEVVDGFLSLVQQQKLPLDDLWAAYCHDQPVAATLIVPGAGRTATCMVGPVLERARTTIVVELIRTACSSQDPQHIRIVQALVDPSSVLEVQALQAAGFKQVAYLQYMEQRIADKAVSCDLGESVQVLTWSQQQRGLFAQAILDSYEQTMDCPGLLGLREIDDIIASHMATGVFLPELWYCVVVDRRPVAVMLLTKIPQRNAMELVYLGVSPCWRRRGMGARLVQYAIAQCQRHSETKLILAVDESNTPAKILYQRFGFVAGARKLALVFTLT